MAKDYNFALLKKNLEFRKLILVPQTDGQRWEIFNKRSRNKEGKVREEKIS